MGKNDRIERLHLVDLDIALSEGEVMAEVCAELTVGLLVQFSELIPAVVDQWPVVRFTGPRNQLEELLNRYDGVRGAFTASAANPDRSTDVDPEFRRTMIGS